MKKSCLHCQIKLIIKHVNLIKKTISLICTCMWISILSNFVSTGICVCTCMWIPILSNFVSTDICVCICMWISILSNSFLHVYDVCTCMWISISSNFVTLDICVCKRMWISILSNSFLHIYVHAHVYVGHSFFRLKFYPVERI
jgi:hypothetical protein